METEKVIYFVRHGQSEDNVAPVFQSPDSPLSESGREQVKSIAERIAKIPFDALVSSTFERAKQTAEIIAKTTGKEPESSDLFVERIKPNEINGKPYEDKEADKIWRNWNKSLYTAGVHVGDGEGFDDIVLRTDKALKYLEDRPEKSIVVVTHGYFLRTIIARILLGELLTGETFRSIQHNASMENTGITVIKRVGAFEEDPRWRLWIYNDHAHLG